MAEIMSYAEITLWMKESYVQALKAKSDTVML